MNTIAILYGGKSGEHEVSCISAASIARHLDPARYNILLIGITKQGRWYLQKPAVLRAARQKMASHTAQDTLDTSMEPLPLLSSGTEVFIAPGAGLLRHMKNGSLRALACDVVFPALHGTFGEDGTIQGLLEAAGLPYVGAPVLGSALCMDKEKAKELWMRAGLPVVDYIALRSADLAREVFEPLTRKIGARFGWPVFVKPARAGSSVGASKVMDAAELEKALRDAFMWDTKVLVEPFVDGREIECAVLGNESPEAFPPGEIAPNHIFYDYNAKYNDPDGARLLVPAPLLDRQAEKIKELAIAAYKICECAGMARVDFFMDKKTSVIYLNEANTIPGFTGISMYPRMCAAGGLSYAALLHRLIELALARDAERESIRYDL